MMGIPPSEARDLTLVEYQGILHNWNEAQGGDSDEDLAPPNAEKIAERRAKLEARGIKVLH